jgi:hypothetical protein
MRAAFVLLAIWPLVHYALTLTLDISPWKLFGWAMYTTPQFYPSARVYEVRGEQTIAVEASALSGEMPAKIAAFERDWLALGELAPPDPIGRELLRSNPEWEGVLIAVSRRRLDRGTARIEMTTTSYTYRRQEP